MTDYLIYNIIYIQLINKDWTMMTKHIATHKFYGNGIMSFRLPFFNVEPIVELILPEPMPSQVGN